MASKSEFPNVKFSVGVKDAAEIISRIEHSSLPIQIGNAVAKYQDSILAELVEMAELRAADSTAYAQRCLLFAICSPQCDFPVNVRAAARMGDRLYDNFSSCDDVYRALTDNGLDSWFTAGAAARAIWHNLAWLRTVDESDMNAASLWAMRKSGKTIGMARKTIAMAVALFDAGEEVYTLDVHMLRGILRAVGMEDCLAGTMIITEAAYPMLEAALVRLHHQIFPDLPVFVSQWAIWSEWRSGSHIVHVGIFA